MNFAYRVVTDSHGRIEYKQRPGGKKHFHISVYIDEPPTILDRIRMIEYRLHDSFKEPIRHNDNREKAFAEQFFTWGKFMVEASVLFVDGSIEKICFNLDYDLPPDYGLNYVQVPVE